MIPYRRDSQELAQWLASVDALVHAGTKETFGLVLLEAMACGRPVVAARAGAVPEIVDQNVGLLAKPGDGENMAETIRALYDRDIEAIGAAARARVLKQFTWTQAFACGSECVHEPRRLAASSMCRRGRRSSWARRRPDAVTQRACSS